MNSKKALLLGGSITEYWARYFSARRFPRGQEYFVVYTGMDHAIPFEPSSARDYWLVNFKLMPTLMQLADTVSNKVLNDILHAYVDIVKRGALAFRQVPTIMPHFTNHNAQALRITQSLLRPINCCPSLHTAAPFFAYNIVKKYLPEREFEVRQYVGDVVSTVIRTKLHALIDIAFGIFLGRQIVEYRLGMGYDDLELFFTQERKRKDNIPYEHIYTMYHEVNQLAAVMRSDDTVLPRIMKGYFKELGLPRIKRERSNCLYDYPHRVLRYAPGLTVGKGLL